ncbi:hypothetical protein [Desulfovibrio sp. JC022]|uniref:capsular polysaccharide export protein, LipB/KpsS family n=1 Tax=Desulfovibrio sp. JC022 TaxID=2593642 RepID=UPI0013D0CF25|nr:hypothetical protein [Desulfovibrio sp. JC022]NDV22159.1 hypothetical protein [Desulfovibrio sp. JC022]
MNRKNILFISRERCDLFFIQAVRELVKDHNIIVVTSRHNQDTYDNIDGVTIEPWYNTDEIINICSQMDSPPASKIEKIEKELGTNCYQFNINYLLYDKFVRRYISKPSNTNNESYNELIPQRLLIEYEYLSKIIKRHNIDYAFFETIDLTDTMILDGMARNKTIKQAFAHEVNPIGGELRLRIVTGQHRRSPKIDHVYHSNKLNEESIRWAEQAIAKYEKEKPNTKYDNYHNELATILPKYTFSQIIDKTKRMLKGDSLAPAFIRLKNRLLSAKYFTNELPKGKIISYFLQLTPEASMCSQVPEFANQEHLIEQIAIHGKYGYTVAVKEHPICYGNREPKFYKELSQLPNVVMLPPSFPTREIITRSTAVVVATATSPGLESLGTGVPVVCLGDPFFNLCKNTVKIETPSQLWDVLDDLSVDHDELVKFVAAMYQATYDHPQYETFKDFEEREGSGIITAQAIKDEIALYESGAL